MRNCLIILVLLFSLNGFGQIENLLDSLILEMEEAEENPCDSIIDITQNGNIDCKLIFEQKEFDIDNKNLIVIARTKVDKNDESIILSDYRLLSKTILKLGYDTCYIRDFNQSDSKREFKDFVTPPDTSSINDWEVDIEFQMGGCMDTDYYSVRVNKTESDFIDFSCLRRVQVYDLDLNKDFSPEIYLISYIWCASEIKIYRIDMK